MKKIIKGLCILFCFIFVINTSYGKENYGRINTKIEKIEAIDRQIQELMKQKSDLELMKKRVAESMTDVTKPVAEGYSPKIALVLSGGGAKGAAHIGVLKAIEKYKVPVDYIIGTSVGSIVGAMYAVGYTPEEIEKLVMSLDFQYLFSNEEKRDLKGVTEKIFAPERPLKITIDENNEINFPKGFVNGEYLYLEFKKIFSKVQNVKDFDKFPIPYRAVATDLNTGKEKIIKEGDIAKTLLMSMAIPSVIVPVEDEKNYYVDGGVTNNFPIVEALKEKADIIIAVDISADSEVITDKSNIISVVNKIATYQGDKKTQLQKDYADILIVPKVKKHNSLDFENIPALIEEGEKAGEHFAHIFENISDEERFNNYKLDSENFKNKNQSIKVENINIVGNKILDLRTVKSLKGRKENLTVEDINLWAEKIYNLSYIDRVFYDIDEEDITFYVKENRGKNFSAGVGYISEYGSIVNVDISGKDFGKINKDTTLSFELSKYPKAAIKNKSIYGVGDVQLIGGYSFSYGQSPVFFYKDGDNVSSYKMNIFDAQFSIGTSIFNDFLLGASIGYKNISSSYDSGEHIKFEDENLKNYTWGAWYLVYDKLDNSFFPKDGLYGKVTGFSGTGFEEDKKFTGYEYNLTVANPLTRRLSISGFLKGGKIDISNIGNSYEEMFKIGGARDIDTGFRTVGFYGLPYTGVMTDEYYSGGISLQYSIFRNIYVLGKYNILTYNSDNFFYQENKKFGDDYVNGYGAGIGWNTFLGPVEAVFTNNIDGNGALFNLYFGYTF